MEFIEFPKMGRFSRECIITEKIDGTNASVNIIHQAADTDDSNVITNIDGYNIRAGSRTRWIKPNDDNFGFANWVQRNAYELLTLGEGNHFGEWWGSGIQRGYGLPKGEKRFSLFNTSRWTEDRPSCCHVVPTLWQGSFDDVNNAIWNVFVELKVHGSLAAPGFMKPEGIVIFHVAANVGFKKTLEKDETPKSLQ